MTRLHLDAELTIIAMARALQAEPRAFEHHIPRMDAYAKAGIPFTEARDYDNEALRRHTLWISRIKPHLVSNPEQTQ